MIGRLQAVVIDSADPRGLARFWAGVLGGRVDADDESWVTLDDPAGRRLAFQLAPDYQPPSFPDPHGSQQLHLDVEVDEVDEAERAVLELGATRVTDAEGEDNFRVFRDPAGHPFCLVFDVAPD